MGVLTVVVALFVLAGWTFGISSFTSVLPGMATMKANTAITFVLLGSCLVARVVSVSSPAMQKGGRNLCLALGAGAFFLSLLTHFEDLFGWQLGIDQLIFADRNSHHALFPGRMSSGTSLCFALVSASLLIAEIFGEPRRWIGDLLAVVAACISLVALVGYAFDVIALYQMTLFGSMALHTAALLFALSIGALITLPQEGLMRHLTSPLFGGRMARPIFLIGIIFMFLIGLLTSRFGRNGTAPGSALAVATVANIAALGVVVWLSAAWMNQLDANRQETEVENARIAAIVKSSGAAIIGKDLHGLITSWNEAATKLYGYTAKEAIGQSIHLIAPPGKEAEMDHILDETQAGRSILPFDTVRKRKDETLVEISLSTSLIRDADGNLVGAAAVARDVSDARHIQRLNEIIVEASPASVVMVDPDGKIALVNSAAVESFGYAPDELIGKGVEVLVPDSVRNGHHILRRGFMQEPVARQMGAGRDLYGRKKNGTEFPVEVGLSPVETLDGTFVLCTVIDITQRKLDEATIQRHVATLEQYNEELKRSNAELEQFAYIASHDLQEPLRMVVSYMGLFESRYKGQFDERADKYINYAVDGASRMQQLVNDLLAYSRVGSQGRPFANVRVDRVLDQVLHGLSGAIAESRTEITRDPMPEVLADELQLGLVFQNLIGNSIKFRGSEPPVIHIGVSEDDAFWTFSVSDNGIGIEPAYAERIFQMFQRLHERGVYEGSGIGLAISKKIIERHGGKIWLDTEPKEGADFRFTLPKERIAA